MVGLSVIFDYFWFNVRPSNTEPLLRLNLEVRTKELLLKKKKELINNLPRQIKFIPVIKRKEIPRYYKFADAIIGQMRAGSMGSVEREAAMCEKPVIHYTNPLFKHIIDGKKVNVLPQKSPVVKEKAEEKATPAEASEVKEEAPPEARRHARVHPRRHDRGDGPG